MSDFNDNNYDVLEGQIPDVDAQEGTSLGKLKYKADQEEENKKDMQSFLNRAKQAEENLMVPGNFDIANGWIPINKDDLGKRALFYPDNWEFRIRPATVEAIKNWSSVDEDNPITLNSILNEIIKSCVTIKSPEGNISWGKLNDWDRFWFIVMIREYTFSKGEAKVAFDDECPNCDCTLHYELLPQALYFEFPDDEIIKKHWNAIERAWYIDPKEYGLEGKQAIKLQIPTLDKTAAVYDWILEQAQQEKKINETFVKFLPWLMKKAPKDKKFLEKEIKECKRIYDSWDVDMFNFMDDVLRNINVVMDQKLKQICPNCGEEVQSTVRFPMGVKSLFTIQNRHHKFGSK